ncbi:MAG TPA: hypothetical protein VIP11_19650 [Gemmatimonadaceae bacterium]
MSVSRIAIAALFGVAVATSAHGQNSTDFPPQGPTRSEFQRRSSVGISLIQSRPTGAFQQNVGFGYGANFAYLFRLDKAGILSLRTDAGFTIYGNEDFETPLSPTVGGRIRVDVQTSNSIFPVSIGPQLTWPRGRVRPYANGGFAAQFFVTSSSVEGSDDDWEFANTTNHSDWTPSWFAGGGLYVPVYQGKTAVLLDLGVQYLNGGRAQYLRPGSIEDLPNAQIRITPLESETHMLLVRVGVKIDL